MIRLQPVRQEDRTLFWNITQKYLYEMTQYYPEAMDEQGNLSYDYFDAYFSQPQRKALFLFNDETMVGFVMINPYSAIGHTPDFTIAEFTIFPSYRRQHYAMGAAKLILSAYPGRWEIKYHEQNTGAKTLWTAAAAPFHPTVYHPDDCETVLEFST